MFQFSQPMYDPEDVRPMSQELEAVGCKSLKTPEDVDEALGGDQSGTALVVINSVCGCAAGGARPAVAASLQNAKIPGHLYTAFAGVDREATARVREYITNYPASSPSVALFKDGKVVYMLERLRIEGRYPEDIAEELMEVYDRFCEGEGPSISADQFQNLQFVQVCGSSLLAKAQKKAEQGG